MILKWLRYIPIVVAIIGVGIHALGLLDLIPNPGFWSDLTMLLIDILVAYGLLQKTLWGYYLAIALYLQQSIMQPQWAYSKYIANFFIVHPVEFLIAPLLVILSLCILLSNKKYFVHQSKLG